MRLSTFVLLAAAIPAVNALECSEGCADCNTNQGLNGKGHCRRCATGYKAVYPYGTTATINGDYFRDCEQSEDAQDFCALKSNCNSCSWVSDTEPKDSTNLQCDTCKSGYEVDDGQCYVCTDFPTIDPNCATCTRTGSYLECTACKGNYQLTQPNSESNGSCSLPTEAPTTTTTVAETTTAEATEPPQQNNQPETPYSTNAVARPTPSPSTEAPVNPTITTTYDPNASSAPVCVVSALVGVLAAAAAL